MGCKEKPGLFKMQLDQNPQHKLVILSKGGSDMKKAAGSVTTIVSISNMHSQSQHKQPPPKHTRRHAHGFKAHKCRLVMQGL